MKSMMEQGIAFSRNQSLLFIKGLILGMGIIVPGISGGTILIAFGIYEKILEDIWKRHFKPYFVMFAGTTVGVFLGSFLFTYLFAFYANPTKAFVLGCLWMSIPFILKRSSGCTKKNMLLLGMGMLLAYGLTKMPTLVDGENLSLGETFFGGVIASGTMMIPGISGSSVLIVLGMYESMLKIVNEMNVPYLMIFLLGALIGAVLLAKLLKTVFEKHQSEVLFFFSGLIIGSSTMIFPETINLSSAMLFLMGVGIVYRWGNYKYRQNSPLMARTIKGIKSTIKKNAKDE
ncbi:DUF368 domain-containing protein [Tindallia californiensis]|uniref:Putative membrane protein n=1 Tax=Tindallia californiensis TaxID=159292 RepID=A0A1H3LQH5_9FIRM|nr:DUF368 domain-containing protein [Tindallia californiensis]SDY66613.1 putative membrane protein [Tindallia californiensis]